MKLRNTTIDNLALARRIRAAGRVIHIAEDDDEASCIPLSELLIYQTGGVTESSAIDCSGATESNHRRWHPRANECFIGRIVRA